MQFTNNMIQQLKTNKTNKQEVFCFFRVYFALQRLSSWHSCSRQLRAKLGKGFSAEVRRH